MPSSFDHIAVLVDDIEAAETQFIQAGFSVTNRLNQGGSDYAERRLVCFEDSSYLELFAFNVGTPGAATHAWAPYAQHGEGFVDYSIPVDDVDALAAAADQAGLKRTPIMSESKTRADGTDWAVKGVGFGVLGLGPAGQPELPFLLEDVTPRGVRSDGNIEHANGATGISRVTIVTADPAAAQQGLTLITGGTIPSFESHSDGECTVYNMSNGTSVALLVPRPGTPAAHRLDQTGPVVYELALKSQSSPLAEASTLLDPALTASARFMI